MDMPGWKRELEMRSLFQIVLCPKGDTVTKGKGDTESLQAMADPPTSMRPNLMDSSLTFSPLAAQEHPLHPSIYTWLCRLLWVHTLMVFLPILWLLPFHLFAGFSSSSWSLHVSGWQVTTELPSPASLTPMVGNAPLVLAIAIFTCLTLPLLQAVHTHTYLPSPLHLHIEEPSQNLHFKA